MSHSENTNPAAQQQVQDEVEEFEAEQQAEEAPDDAEKASGIADIKPARDDEGKREADEYYVDELGMYVDIREPTNYEIENFIDPFYDDEQNADNEDLATLADRLYPAFEGMTADDLEEARDGVPEGILIGAQMARPGDHQMEIELLRGDLSDETLDEIEGKLELQERLSRAGGAGR